MRSLLLALSLFLPAATGLAGEAPGRLYEMRVYDAAEGKLDALHARFRNHTTKLFEKHGMTNVGYFVPAGENPERKIVYFLSYPDREARAAAWKAFADDPEWKRVASESEKDGRLVAKAVSCQMHATDYSPALVIEKAPPRVFELRTYKATPGNLPALNGRFRDHTVRLFAKHGMHNLIYWNLAAEEPAADTALIYLLAHANQEAARGSFAAFRDDPEWTKARTASEEKAGGSLTAPQGGVVSEFLVPTDYSPLE